MFSPFVNSVILLLLARYIAFSLGMCMLFTAHTAIDISQAVEVYEREEDRKQHLDSPSPGSPDLVELGVEVKSEEGEKSVPILSIP